MSKRLSDEDVNRIAEAVAKKIAASRPDEWVYVYRTVPAPWGTPRLPIVTCNI